MENHIQKSTNNLNKSGETDSTSPSPKSDKKTINQIFELKNDLNEIQNIYKSVQLMKNLRHENILRLLSGELNEDKLKLEFEHVDYNLDQVISLSSHSLTNDLTQYIFYQIVLGVSYLHSMNVQHLDLKPSNIFVKKNMSIKIAGFGTAKPTFIQEKDTPVLVKQDFFTSPESILNNNKNEKCPFKADIWSIGCIFFELLNKKCRLGQKRHYLELLNLMMKLIGKPDKTQLGFVKNECARDWIKHQKNYPKIQPSMYLENKKVPESSKHLLNQLLKFNPTERPSIDQILKHPYFASIYDPIDLNYMQTQLNEKDFEGCSQQIFHPNQVYRLIQKSIKEL
jgi:mitogen-activated protein kinase 1/3